MKKREKLTRVTRGYKNGVSEKGITLIALVITIVVLIILAVISIRVVFSNDGIISRAERAKVYQANTEKDDLEKTEKLFDIIESKEPPIMGQNGKQLVTSIKSTEHGTIIAEDSKGNQVVVPGGFKISKDSGTTVQQGIVIEDAEKNQFVWIPVSNINKDGSNKIIKDDGTNVEIVLGRYIFNGNVGTETLVQKGSDYAEKNSDNIYTIDTYYQELNISRESNYNQNLTGENATSKNLKKFVESVDSNKGYYLARYEASYGGGTTPGKYVTTGTTVNSIITNQKPLSQVSETKSTSNMNYVPKTLWNFITQGDASKVCRNMYDENTYVESDLTNSYAWDTAIVYIQEMEKINYAKAGRGENTTLKNTGETGDKVCNIFDMAGNLYEWTTENSSYTTSDYSRPCVARGGGYGSPSNYTNTHGSYGAIGSAGGISFRPIIYIK